MRRGDSSAGPILGKGILTIAIADFARQMTTLRVLNAGSLAERLAASARFGRFFAGVLQEVYGGVLAGPTVFHPDALPRKRRALRAAPPEVHAFSAADGAQLRFLRYRGGPKGPVILAHGLGVSSLIFRLDTIETNLTEYLYARGFDVWLLDFRASIELPASATPFTGDDVATQDYPAAVRAVRERTGARTVQVVAHSFGSATFVMAMLAGLEGVRAAVCSQIGAHLVVPTTTRIRAGLHLPALLGALGIESLSAYVDTDANWKERLFDRALELYPTDRDERCPSAACHRITFIYGPLYEHNQLNAATHEALHELFGVTNVRTLDHVGRMVRAGRVCAADGRDAYLPQLPRLAIPIAFVHGAEDQCFLPRGTELTYDLLRERFGAQLYRRQVIPGYGHMDCVFGKDAVNDVYPLILEHLNSTGV